MGIKLNRAALFGLAFTLASGTAAADPNDSKANKGRDARADSSMVAAIDKETGKLRAATAREVAELARLDRIRESAEPRAAGQPPRDEAEAIATMRVFPSGHVGMELPLSLYSTLQATIGEDGTIAVEHADPAHEHSHGEAHGVAPQREGAAREIQ